MKAMSKLMIVAMVTLMGANAFAEESKVPCTAEAGNTAKATTDTTAPASTNTSTNTGTGSTR